MFPAVLIMASNMVITYSDVLFDLYSGGTDPSKKGSRNGWPYCDTEIGLRIFQEAAEPYVSGTIQPPTLSSPPPPPPRSGQGSSPIWPQIIWPVGVGVLVVIGCVLALVWQWHWQILANSRIERQQAEIAKGWSTVAEQLVQSHLEELRVLNSNEVAFATSQAQMGADLVKLGTTDSKLVALASAQADAAWGLATEQATLTRTTTNLLASLRQTFEQGLSDVASQSRAETAALQTQVAEAATNLEASLGRTFQQGFAEAASQSRAGTEKLQTQVAEVVASQKALLDRLSGPTKVPGLALAMPGVRTQAMGNSILITFDDGLFLHGTCFTPDAKARLRAVAKALAQAATALRIEVIGCADDNRIFRSWTAQFEESLGLERATAVADYFIELGLFAPRRLAASSSSAADRPFPSDTVENRARNRTVMLRVRADERPMQEYGGRVP